MAISYMLYWTVNKISPLGVSKSEELLGLDISQHDEVGLSLEEVSMFGHPHGQNNTFNNTSPYAA